MQTFVRSFIVIFSVLIFTRARAQVATQETGLFNRTQLENQFGWFKKGFDEYKTSGKACRKLNKELKGKNILVFGASWCPDTKNLLPVVMKVLHASGFPEDSLRIYLVDHDLKSPGREEEQYQIKVIPTFIIFERKTEKGRLVESTDQLVEQALLKILQN